MSLEVCTNCGKNIHRRQRRQWVKVSAKGEAYYVYGCTYCEGKDETPTTKDGGPGFAKLTLKERL